MSVATALEVGGPAIAAELRRGQIINLSSEGAYPGDAVYEAIASSLGTIMSFAPVNKTKKARSQSRDIKPDEEGLHFYTARTAQPLHTDYAYYPEKEAAKWLMLFCVVPSPVGGKTNVLSVAKIVSLLKKHDPNLLKGLKADVVWRLVTATSDIIHKRPVLTENQMAWNYWQIDPALNSPMVIEAKEKFKQFLDHAVPSLCGYDFSKDWAPGDCIIFDDRQFLHGREAFRGDRWLKDFAISEI